MAQFNPLRPVTQRLNSTPVEDLPRYAGYLATSILNCSELLQNSEGSKSDAFVQVHKLITRVSSLLQDRTPEGRFTAIVLVKALVEASGPHILATSGSAWVRGLLLCLNKQDPPQVKLLSIATIARIFLLTRDNQSMLREITTPSLPPFITAYLSAIKPRIASSENIEKQVPSPLLKPVFQCWTQLIRVFPSTFRPFVPSIRTILLSLLSQHVVSQDVKQVATELHASLHFCAPKDTSGAEWAQSMKQIIEAAHQTADLIFRSIIEEWSSASGRQILTRVGKKARTEPRLGDVDALGMTAWAGLQSGCSRLFHHLQLIEQMIASPHAQAMRIPIAEVMDLTARIAAVVLPNKSYTLRENKEIPRDEREELYTNLPRLHQALLSIHGQLASTLGLLLMPVSHQLLSQVWDILTTESSDVYTRTSLYKVMRILLQESGVSFKAIDSGHITSLVHLCCQDLQRMSEKQTQVNGGSKDSKTGPLSIDLQQMTKERKTLIQAQSTVEEAANALLPVLLAYIPYSILPSSTRTELDRTTILLGHEEGLMASVMNPPVPRKGGRAAPSVLPFLARIGSSGPQIESLMRPRMPVVHSSHTMDGDDHEVGGEVNQDDNQMMSSTEILHAVDDHVTQQLQDDKPMSTTLDQSPARKRDYETADGDRTHSLPEPSKKARFNSPLPADSPSAAQLQSEVKEAGESIQFSYTEPSEQADAMEIAAPEDTTSRTIEPSSAVGHATKSHQQQDGDDSDGSEIPQIDTALSSDEEDDDDEADI